MSFTCGSSGPPEALLRALEAMKWCCIDAAENGPADCTCWEPVYDHDQAEPRLDEPAGTMPTMCENCAYRLDSPERAGDDRYTGFAPAGQTFWCHHGMRRVIRWEHPAGMSVAADMENYDPPQRKAYGVSVPFQADGAPGLRCAGWAART